MTDVMEFDEQTAHKHFSAGCFNKTWDYIDIPNRSSEDEQNMLLNALASLYHWKARTDVNPTNLSVSYWLVARVYSLLGQTGNAREFGLLSLDESQKEGVPPFYLGYSYEALSRAEALAGQHELMITYLELAKKAGEQVQDVDAKKMLEDDLQSIG